jgi:hypothetical protein
MNHNEFARLRGEYLSKIAPVIKPNGDTSTEHQAACIEALVYLACTIYMARRKSEYKMPKLEGLVIACLESMADYLDAFDWVDTKEGK